MPRKAIDRPNNKPRKIYKYSNDYLDTHERFTPDSLREIASKMEEDGILSIEMEPEEYGCSFEITRMETQEECDQRYEKEMEEYNLALAKASADRFQEIEKAKKLLLDQGFSIKKENE